MEIPRLSPHEMTTEEARGHVTGPSHVPGAVKGESSTCQFGVRKGSVIKKAPTEGGTLEVSHIHFTRWGRPRVLRVWAEQGCRALVGDFNWRTLELDHLR